MDCVTKRFKNHNLNVLKTVGKGTYGYVQYNIFYNIYAVVVVEMIFLLVHNITPFLLLFPEMYIYVKSGIQQN